MNTFDTSIDKKGKWTIQLLNDISKEITKANDDSTHIQRLQPRYKELRIGNIRIVIFQASEHNYVLRHENQKLIVE